MQTINLKFPKSETRLAGFPYGEDVYNDQVKDTIKFEDRITIVFPDQVEKVASSFVQGFFSGIVAEIGYKGIDEKIEIIAKTDALVTSIRNNIY